MAPFDILSILGKPAAFAVFILLGAGFGFVLERAGFGDSRKLAAQFYFHDQTVLKVMFTAIVTAMLLLSLASGFGLLDFNRVFVNPTYLAPGIVGGLVMGVGFILGGFCPGTSVVAAATGKVDGIFFVAGVLGGVFIFGETVQFIPEFFHSTFLGRITLAEFLGVPHGVAVFGVVLLALSMFTGAEMLERFLSPDTGDRIKPKKLASGALLLLVFALLALLLGQPTPEDLWAKTKHRGGENLLATRAVHVHPLEYLELTRDYSLRVLLIDLRPEAEYNLFHLAGARPVTLEQLNDPFWVRQKLGALEEAVIFLTGNDEKLSTQGWKMLHAQGFSNAYILEGGMNHWLDFFRDKRRDPHVPLPLTTQTGKLRHLFHAALGDRCPEADPDEIPTQVVFIKKVRRTNKARIQGGCS